MAFERSSGNRVTGDLPDLLRRYILQETVEPFRSVGRFLAYRPERFNRLLKDVPP